MGPRWILQGGRPIIQVLLDPVCGNQDIGPGVPALSDAFAHVGPRGLIRLLAACVGCAEHYPGGRTHALTGDFWKVFWFAVYQGTSATALPGKNGRWRFRNNEFPGGLGSRMGLGRNSNSRRTTKDYAFACSPNASGFRVMLSEVMAPRKSNPPAKKNALLKLPVDFTM